ncbi:MAG: hypothetical protein WAK62_21690 [Terriglobales bacterium]
MLTTSQSNDSAIDSEASAYALDYTAPVDTQAVHAARVLTSDAAIAVAAVPANDRAPLSTDLAPATEQVFATANVVDTTLAVSLSSAQAYKVTGNNAADSSATSPTPVRENVNAGPAPLPPNFAPVVAPFAEMTPPETPLARYLASNTGTSAPNISAGKSPVSANVFSAPDPVFAFRPSSNVASTSLPATPLAPRGAVNGSPAPLANLASIAEPNAKPPDFETPPVRNLDSYTADNASNNNPGDNSTSETSNNVSNGDASLTSDLTASYRNLDSGASAPIATTNEEHAKPLISGPSFTTATGTATASQPTAVDKKTIAAIETSTTSPATGPSVMNPVPTAVSQPVVAALPGSNPSTATTTSPLPAAPLPAPANSGPAPALPQTHQMLDSAPPAAPASDPTALPGDVHTDAQTPAQMHVGLRTDAFGAVEIHTVVQQSQIGITVHSDRDISRWFSSEVPGLESGLNNSHLNLTGVNFDNARSAVQAETGFQQGQPRQQQPQTFGAPAPSSSGSALAEPETTEFATANVPAVGLSTGPAQVRVSILA